MPALIAFYSGDENSNADMAATVTAFAVVAYNFFLSETNFRHNRNYLLVVLAGLSLLAVDRAFVLWPRRRIGQDAPLWPLWLLRFEGTVPYLASGYSKLIDPDWWGGLVTWDRVVRYRAEADAILGSDVVDFFASREFHAMPVDEKLKLRINENNIGYMGVNQSMQRASTVHKATRPNFNESFFISHDRGADHPAIVAGESLRGRNQWPAGHEAMRADMMRYFKTLEGVGQRMLPVLARALGLPPDWFAPFFSGEAHINLRFLHYPPQETDDDEQFGQGPHTDNSFITILARTDVPGLAVRLPSGEWLAPPVIEGTFLVHHSGHEMTAQKGTWWAKRTKH